MVDWVEINMTDNPTLERMSDYVGYSAFYCSAKFHETIGISFKEYVFRRKMSLAAAELRETKRRIIDIAFKYGFSSNEAFTRSFFKIYGYTPNHYRKAIPSISFYERPALQLAKTP
jgi:AraC-like DNA-binding protein